MDINNSLTVQWIIYKCVNKEQRSYSLYPITFKKCLSRLRTNIDGTAAKDGYAAYCFNGICPQSSTDLPDTNAVYFWETTNNRLSYVYIIAIGL